MTWLIIGLGAGLILGLSGAGGAVLAIPVFVHVLHFSLRDATIMSLLVVIIGASLQSLYRYKDINRALALLTVASSFLGGWLVRPLKAASPELLIGIVLTVFILWGLAWTWFQAFRRPSDRSVPVTQSRVKIVTGGLLLGALTTMTGLGGGVLLVPWFQFILKRPLKEAMATSLVCILFSSLFSFLIQVGQLGQAMNYTHLFWLFIGLVVSAYGISIFLRQASASVISWAQRITYTLVASAAVVGLWLR